MGFFDAFQSAMNNASGNRPSNNYRARKIMNQDSFGGRSKGYAPCNKCGKRVNFSKAEADHIFPRSKGGPDSSFNIQVLCRPCNRSKSDKLF